MQLKIHISLNEYEIDQLLSKFATLQIPTIIFQLEIREIKKTKIKFPKYFVQETSSNEMFEWYSLITDSR